MKEWKAAFAMGNAATDGWSTRARHWVGSLCRFRIDSWHIFVTVRIRCSPRFIGPFFSYFLFFSLLRVPEFQDVVNFRDFARFRFAEDRVYVGRRNNERRDGIGVSRWGSDLFNFDREFL